MIVILLSVIRRLGGSADGILMGKIMQRDAHALSDLYDRYATLLYSMIKAILKNDKEAEDVLQEVFLLVWNRCASFDASKASAYTWIVTLARNKAIDQLRAKSFQNLTRNRDDIEIDTVAASPEDSPLDFAINQERAQLVRKALEQIPHEQREIIHVAYFGGLTQSEIANRYQLPLGTVKTRMRQGMKKLQTLLAEGAHAWR